MSITGLPPLPPLRPKGGAGRERARSKAGAARESGTGWDAPASVEVTPRQGEDTRPGRWWRTESAKDEIGGTCFRCGRQVRALDLGWLIPPFETEEAAGWACKDCRRHINLGMRPPVKQLKSRPVEELNRPVGGARAMAALLGSLIEGNLHRLTGRKEVSGGWIAVERGGADELARVWATAAHIARKMEEI